MSVALMGSVSSTLYALDALVHAEVDVAGVLAVAREHAHGISDYRDLAPAARAANVAFLGFRRVTEAGVAAFLTERRPDVLLVIGLSQLVPQPILDLAPAAALGFHPTLLPEGRGRAPVAWTILRGARAAVNLFHLTHEADAGDIVVQREVPVRGDDYAEDLIERTNHVLWEALVDLAPRLASLDLAGVPQDHARATTYGKRTPDDGLLDWGATTDEAWRLVRAASRPYPGAFTTTSTGQRFVVWRADPARREDVPRRATPGLVVRVSPARGTLVATNDGGLWLTETEGPAPVAGDVIGAR